MRVGLDIDGKPETGAHLESGGRRLLPFKGQIDAAAVDAEAACVMRGTGTGSNGSYDGNHHILRELPLGFAQLVRRLECAAAGDAQG